MRPYSTFAIDDLEKLVDENTENKSLLAEVKNELEHRSSKKRQVALIEKIEKLVAVSYICIELPPGWIDHLALEKALSAHLCESIKQGSVIKINVPVGCNIMVSTAVQMLSLINQLLEDHCEVSINFCAGWSGTMSYLKRINFFKHLNSNVKVTPSLRGKNLQTEYEGNNYSVVEIEKIDLAKPDKNLPTRLTQGVLNDTKLGQEDKRRLNTAVSTLFSELTTNVCFHSKTVLPAYAVCQRYTPDNKAVVHVTVCDSGMGILDTIRPALPIHYSNHPEYQLLTDEQLILKMFLEGVSSKGDNNGGSGLVSCAKQAMKFRATICIRTNDILIQLTPSGDYYVLDTQPLPYQLMPLKGTYITFQIPLDNLT